MSDPFRAVTSSAYSAEERRDKARAQVLTSKINGLKAGRAKCRVPRPDLDARIAALEAEKRALLEARAARYRQQRAIEIELEAR